MTIFEAAPEPGGVLRLAIPSYRLPAEVVERDIANVTALGVEIRTNTTVESLDALKQQGFDAVLLATGTHESMRLGVPGEELDGVTAALDFLRAVKLGEPVDLGGKRVAVIGGGNVAIDAARSALRLGAAPCAWSASSRATRCRRTSSRSRRRSTRASPSTTSWGVEGAARRRRGRPACS